jgi:hypothetical protein
MKKKCKEIVFSSSKGSSQQLIENLNLVNIRLFKSNLILLKLIKVWQRY